MVYVEFHLHLIGYTPLPYFETRIVLANFIYMLFLALIRCLEGWLGSVLLRNVISFPSTLWSSQAKEMQKHFEGWFV
jgi:hypothetical protein